MILVRYSDASNILKEFIKVIAPYKNGSYAEINRKTRRWSKARNVVKDYRKSKINKNRKFKKGLVKYDL